MRKPKFPFHDLILTSTAAHDSRELISKSWHGYTHLKIYTVDLGMSFSDHILTYYGMTEVSA